jgi:serine/threonine protein kinase
MAALQSFRRISPHFEYDPNEPDLAASHPNFENLSPIRPNPFESLAAPNSEKKPRPDESMQDLMDEEEGPSLLDPSPQPGAATVAASASSDTLHVVGTPDYLAPEVLLGLEHSMVVNEPHSRVCNFEPVARITTNNERTTWYCR